MNRKQIARMKAQMKTEAVERKATMDSFSNPLAALGLGSSNLLNATQYQLTRLTRDYNLLNTLYRNSWIAKKIINAVPNDMVKNWFSITAELSPEVQDRYTKLEQKTKVREKILEGLYWGRLYGGAAAIMMIDGHEDMLEEPLIVDDVLPGSFCGLMIVDRWSGIYPSIEIVEEITDTAFGMPMYYEVRDVATAEMQRVHHSRVIRFTGRKLPFWENQAEMLWGASELEHVFDELAKRDNTSWNIAALVFQANLLVNKVDGLDQLLSVTDQQMQNDYFNVKSAQNKMRSNTSMMIIGKQDEVSALQYTFAGLNDIYESFMMDVSGAAEIPVTILFGRSPAGMNATGESDLQNYYDNVSRSQETQLKPAIDQLLPVMFMSEFGAVPNDLGIKFNPIKTMSAQEQADWVGKVGETIEKMFTAGIINQKIALKELHELSYNSNLFTNITSEDIENASTDFVDEKALSALIRAQGGAEGETESIQGAEEHLPDIETKV